MTPLTIPGEIAFEDQFRLLTDFGPLSWQSRLFKEYFQRGDLPAAIDMPTGLGKTAVMALWLIARARGASLPRRLVYVVDRRAVVDQATESAVKLRENLDKPEALQLKSSLGLHGRSLPISTLRGQHVDNREWLEDPSSIAIIVATVDMAGSRLLFEGYGVSRKMRPYHAGLLGSDALVMLDEAHLVPPFERLLEAVETCPDQFAAQAKTDRAIVPPFKLLSLSATGRERKGNVFRLEQQDIDKDQTVKDRLTAKKSLKLLTEEEKNLVDALARHAWKLSQEGTALVRCIIFCDKRDAAEKVKAEIDKIAKGAKVVVAVELLVGARRVREREMAAKKLKSLGFIAGSQVARTTPAFLIATSAGEVGVDLDADHMVCDLVAWERMVQRLGRVNRRGNGEAQVIVIAAEPERPTLQKPTRPDIPQPTKPTNPRRSAKGADRTELERHKAKREQYKAELDRYKKQKKAYDEAWKRFDLTRKEYEQAWAEYRVFEVRRDALKELRNDASPGAVRSLSLRASGSSKEGKSLRLLLDAATTSAPMRPTLTRALVDAWSMTVLERHTGRPEVGPWLRGWVTDDRPQTAVLWRRYLPIRSSDPQPSRKEIEAYFEATPPHVSEVLETETFLVAAWLMRRAEALLGLANSEETNADLSSDVLPPEPEPAASVRRSRHDAEDEQSETQEEDVSPSAQQPAPRADEVVGFVLSSAGDLRAKFHLRDLASTDKESARDIKETLEKVLSDAMFVADARLGGLTDGLLKEECPGIPQTADAGAAWVPAMTFRLRGLRAGDALPQDVNWRERLRFAQQRSEDGDVLQWLIIEKWHDDSTTADDRAISRPQILEEHQGWTEQRARELAFRLGLNAEYREMLALAARLHDEGKRAERWQRAFNARKDGNCYAKTEGPLNAALLDGYRHEFGSLPYASSNEEFKRLATNLQDLALHIIAAHHGWARPVISTAGCEDVPPSALVERVRDVALRFARLQKRWGPWGLAWWETLLRAADQQASRDNDARGDA